MRRLEGPEEGKEWRKRAEKKERWERRKKRALIAPEAAETTGQGTKFCPNFVRREVPKGKATLRWVGETPSYLHHLPRPEIPSSNAAQRPEGLRGERPSLQAPGPPPGGAPARPGLHPELLGPTSGPARAPASASHPAQPRPQAPARPGHRPRTPDPESPIPAQPYVLSWLKLAKSSWPAPASPL